MTRPIRTAHRRPAQAPVSSLQRHEGSSTDLPPADLPLAKLLGETRARIVDLLRTAPRTIGDLAEELNLSEQAVRRHLRVLERDDLVDSRLQRQGGRGRPSTQYRLNDRGHRLYPDRTAEFANELWEYVASEHGRQAIVGFLRWRQNQQQQRYADELDDVGTDVRDRVMRLAELLTEDGFLAEADVVHAPDGRELVQLTQTHCAVREVAAEHPEICSFEAALFKGLLGAKVSRRETLAAGASQCVCTIDAGARQDGTFGREGG